MTNQSDYLREELYDRMKRDDSLFDFLQQGSLDGMWYWDVEQPENEWMSPEFKALFGYQDHEVPNTSAWWQQHIDQGQLPEVMTRFQKHLDDGSEPYDQIVRYSHRDGSDVWVRCRGIAIRDEQLRPIRMLGCHTDVTELMHTQLELARTIEELGQVNAELERFASAASHDLQEPLRKISMLGSRLERGLSQVEGLDPTLMGYLQGMQSTAVRMSSMLRDVLNYAKLSRHELPRERVALSQIAADVVLDLAARIEQTGAHFKVEPQLPEAVCHPTYIYQLLLNLSSNALKFASPGEPPRVYIRGQQVPGGVQIEVKDEGIGFDAARFGAKIFEPFERLYVKSKYPGSGLGLATCRRIVELHGGTITAISAPGEGATFRAFLPS